MTFAAKIVVGIFNLYVLYTTYPKLHRSKYCPNSSSVDFFVSVIFQVNDTSKCLNFVTFGIDNTFTKLGCFTISHTYPIHFNDYLLLKQICCFKVITLYTWDCTELGTTFFIQATPIGIMLLLQTTICSMRETTYKTSIFSHILSIAIIGDAPLLFTHTTKHASNEMVLPSNNTIVTALMISPTLSLTETNNKEMNTYTRIT